MRLLAAALLMAAVPAAAAPVTAAAWAGTWFGTGQPGDRSEMYIDYFEAGGVFHNHHRECHQGTASDLFETGRWSIAGDLLTIDIATVNGVAQPRSDHYRALSADAKTQKYIYLPNNFGYTAHKVDAAFQMPPCDLTS